MTLKIKRYNDTKEAEFTEIITILYEMGASNFIFEDVNKTTKHIPIDEIESFTIDVFNMVIDSTEDILKHVKGMKSITYNGEKRRFRFDYVYGRGTHAHLDIQLGKVHFLNGIY